MAGAAAGLLAAGPGHASQEPAYGARSSQDKLDIRIGPVLWSRPDRDERFAVHVLIEDQRTVGYLALVPPSVPVRPVLAPRVSPLSRVTGSAGATIGLNGGFFNRSDGVPASYLVADGKLLADPRQNRALAGNPKLGPHLARIFDRTEWRVWDTPVGRRMAFEPHHVKAAPGWRLVHALQAGPQLLPFMTLREGAFVRGHDDSIGSTRRLGRSAIGIRNDGVVMLASFPKPPSRGLTILELQTLMANYGAAEALALDGGDAAGLVIRPADPEARLWWGHDTRVRSALVVMAEPAKGSRARKPPPGHPAPDGAAPGHGKPAAPAQ